MHRAGRSTGRRRGSGTRARSGERALLRRWGRAPRAIYFRGSLTCIASARSQFEGSLKARPVHVAHVSVRSPDSLGGLRICALAHVAWRHSPSSRLESHTVTGGGNARVTVARRTPVGAREIVLSLRLLQRAPTSCLSSLLLPRRATTLRTPKRLHSTLSGHDERTQRIKLERLSCCGSGERLHESQRPLDQLGHATKWIRTVSCCLSSCSSLLGVCCVGKAKVEVSGRVVFSFLRWRMPPLSIHQRRRICAASGRVFPIYPSFALSDCAAFLHSRQLAMERAFL